MIKCCPFCGSHKVEIARTNENACWVVCEDCGAEAQSDKTRKGAIQNWNRRHYDDLPSTITDDMDKEWKDSK
jgi:Lar family restriction alleviation protein